MAQSPGSTGAPALSLKAELLMPEWPLVNRVRGRSRFFSARIGLRRATRAVPISCRIWRRRL